MPEEITFPPTGIVVPFDIMDAERKIVGGFRQEWCAAKAEGFKFELLSGAGCGNPYLYLYASNGTTTVNHVVDMRPVFEAWIDAILTQQQTPK